MTQSVVEHMKTPDDATQIARMFASYLPAGIFVADVAGENTFTNKWFAKKLGTCDEELAGSSWLDFIHDEDRDAICKAWEDFWEDDVPYAVEYRAIAKSGSIHFFRCKAEKFVNSEGSCRAIGLIEDVSTEKLVATQVDRISLGLFNRIERSRNEIAEELHASVGQELALLKLKAQSGAEDFTPGELLPLLDSLIAKTDDLAMKLSPLNLNMLGLSDAIADLLDQTVRRHGEGLLIDVSLQGLDDAVPKFCAIQIYRIVQDAVAGMLKYSNATRITLRTEHRDNDFFLVVSDNGQSLHPGQRRKDSFGIHIMAERARLIGARLTFSEGRFGGEVSIAIRSKLL